MSKRGFHIFEDHPISFRSAQDKGYFRAYCDYVVDGDTADFIVDLGFSQYSYLTIRFEGIDTEELVGTRGETRERAFSAKDLVAEHILNEPVLLSTQMSTTFGRYVARVFYVYKHPETLKVSFEDISKLLKNKGLSKAP